MARQLGMRVGRPEDLVTEEEREIAALTGQRDRLLIIVKSLIGADPMNVDVRADAIASLNEMGLTDDDPAVTPLHSYADEQAGAQQEGPVTQTD